MYPTVKHEDREERKDAIMSIFNSLVPSNITSFPTTVGSLQGPIKLSEDIKNEVEIDLADYMKNLPEKSPFSIQEDIDPKWTLFEQITKCPPDTWQPIMKLVESNIQTISYAIDAIGAPRYLPNTADVFNAFRLTALNNLKVIIVGMDPYHQMTYGRPDACGLSFSYRRDFPVPARSSLKNIYKEIKTNNYSDFIVPIHGDLTSWAHQGVLLLNSALTVLANSPGSHVDRWRGFTSIILSKIVELIPGVIIMCWGNDAKKAIKEISTKCVNWDTENATAIKSVKNKPILLETSHPSGYSFTRGFFGSQHFLKVNTILQLQEKEQINWNLY